MRKYRIVKKSWDMGYDPQIKRWYGWSSLLNLDHGTYFRTFEETKQHIDWDIEHREIPNQVVWSNE